MKGISRSDAAEELSQTDLPAVRAVPAFEQFFVEYWDSAVSLAYALSGSRLASEDIAQDAFLAAYRRWSVIAGYDRPEAWVRRVVANKSMSAVRRRGAETRALLRLWGRRTPLPELSAEADDVLRAVRRLPKRQAQVVALYYLQDLSLDDVAASLELSVETVRTHLRRARKTLTSRLEYIKEDL